MKGLSVTSDFFVVPEMALLQGWAETFQFSRQHMVDLEKRNSP